jgi:hypothetical protein
MVREVFFSIRGVFPGGVPDRRAMMADVDTKKKFGWIGSIFSGLACSA